MSRLLLTGLMAASVMITGCQQQKLGSDPTPAAQPKSAAPPPSNNPPPRGPGPGPGPVVQQPPPATPPPPGYGPGPGPGTVVRPPPPMTPPPPGYGPGPGTNYPPPPPSGPGAGPGTNYPPPPPGNGPGTNNPPPPIHPTDPYPPYTPNEPPISYPPVTPPPTNTPTGTPPTTVNPPVQQPTPPNLQPAPTVPSVNLPPTNYPPAPQCVGASCGNQQIIPPPAPPVAQQPPVQQPPVQQPPMQQPPLQQPPAPPMMNKPVAPPAQPQQPIGPPAPPFTTVDKPMVAPSPEQPPVVTQPPVVQPPTPVVPQGPKQECRDIPLNMELSTTKLDVLFVLDTSASMREGRRSGMAGELGLVAKQMATFARGLDPKTDFRIGLILGHGPDNSKHPGYKHGSLFQVNSSDPAVIDFAKMQKACGNGKNARECALTKVVAALEKKMHALPTDHSDAQGEALMLSLYDAASNESMRQAIKKQGLFRDDAVLSIIPISDEQDVCFDYSTCTQNEGEDDAAFKSRCTPAQVKLRDGKGKLIGTTGQDPHEVNFYNDVCKRAANNTPLTPSNVLTALQNMKKGDIRQLAITPIVYLDNSKPVRAEDENEMGHGYIELAQFGKGMVADLNTAHLSKGESNFEPILKNFAAFIDSKMKIQPPFTCASDFNPAAVDLRSMDVHIVDQNGKDLQLFGPACTGENCAGEVVTTLNLDSNGNGTHLIVDADSVNLYKALKARGFKKGKVQIKFKNRSDFDEQGNRKTRMMFRPKRKVKAAAAAPAPVASTTELPANGSALDQLQQ